MKVGYYLASLLHLHCNMATLLFSLRGVPDDEAEEVRELLERHGIDFYETSAGNWGISMPALWLRKEDDLPEARRLVDVYQRQRYTEQRAIYERLKREGKHRRLLDVFRERPVSVLLYVAIIVLIFYVSVRLLFELGL